MLSIDEAVAAPFFLAGDQVADEVESEKQVVVQSIDWRRAFPWLALARCFRLALNPGKLTLASLALLVTSVGWWAIGGVFSSSDDPAVVNIRQRVHWPWREESLSRTDLEHQIDPGHPMHNIVASTAEYYVRPGRDLLDSHTQNGNPVTFAAFSLAGLKTLWMIAVWTLLGGAIARISVLEFTQDRRTSMFRALDFAALRWRAFAGGPVVMLAGIFVAAIPVVIVGSVSQLGNFGYGVTGVIWPVAILFGLIMGFLAVGLFVGWPLMASAVAAEREEDADAFGAISLSYEYGFQHIFKYLLYILFVVIVGSISWMIVTFVAEQILHLTAWAATWGAPERNNISNEMLSLSQLHSRGEIDRAGSFLIRCWTAVIQTAVVAYAFTFFWSAAAGIYVLLRNHAEGVPFTEVYLPEDEEPGLPSFERDPAGVPVLSHEMPVSDDLPTEENGKSSGATDDTAKNGDKENGNKGDTRENDVSDDE